MFNFNHLYYFYVTVEEGSVTAGSRRLRISQPALSAQLKQFETQIGRQVFTRAGRKLVLTDTGNIVYGYARQMFELAEELSERLRRVGKTKATRIHLGVSSEVERPFAARFSSFLFSENKKTGLPNLRLSSFEHEDLNQKLKDRTVDAVLSNQPYFHEDVMILGSLPMPVVLLIPNKVKRQARQMEAPPKSKTKTTTTKAVTKISSEQTQVLNVLKKTEAGLVLPSSRLRLRREIDEFLEKHKINQEVVFESDSISSVARAIYDGLGIGFLPLPYFTLEFSSAPVQIIAPKSGLWTHPIWLMARKGKTANASLLVELNHAFQKFSEKLRR